jgi:hypothetical protein
MLANYTSPRALLREYFTLGILAAIGSIVGIGSGLNSLFGSGSSQSATGSSSGQTGVMNEISPEMLQAYQSWISQNPQYANAMQSGADTAGALYTNTGAMDTGMGTQLTNAGNNLFSAGNAAEAAATNPQTGLYNQMQQQTLDTANAGSSMRGIGMSPVAAGITNQADNQFNNAWNNQMVGNAATGAQALSGATSAAGGAYNSAGNLFSGGAGATLTGAQTPWNAQNTIAGEPFQIGGQYASTMNTAFNPNLAGYNQQNSASGINALMTGANQLGGNSGQFGNWLNNSFGGGNSASSLQAGQGVVDQGANLYGG